MNALALLQILNAAITVAANATVSIQNISAILTKAQAEGRDVTDEELKSVMDETDKVTAEAKTILSSL